jgi:hypothetical protein
MERKQRITRWEYVQQCCREIFHQQGFEPRAPRTRQEWDDFFRDEYKVAREASLRMGDLFYNPESETFREDLTVEESRIALSPDLTHEVRKTRIYLLRCAQYAQRLNAVDAEKVTALFALALTSDPEERVWSEKLQVTHAFRSQLRDKQLTISDEDKLLAKNLGITLD